ncbi:MAG: AraC family transcriptional regulator [Duncaniella sp.]|uniref:AraC family transcriptional regulator n=1 Tax=Duncaniella sp. TaxID=2518496 RepID=UPI0023D730B4|nr:helix-turn-helix domain-containing protein [Duncaniella sp.]MDE6089772.1 AraC family transcriptional regulator [Duncaniella sp.]
MTRSIPIHYLNEDSTFDSEVLHLTPVSVRTMKLGDYDDHIDDCYTIILVTKGCGSADIDFHTVPMSQGQLGIIAPGQIHSNINIKECVIWMLRMSPEMMDDDYRYQLDEYAMTGNPVMLPEETIVLLCEALEFLSKLMASMNDRQPMKSVLFNMLNVVLGIITPRILNGQAKSPLRSTEITVKFKQMLPKFVRRQKKPSFYANELCISEVYLNEVVKKTTGMTPSGWINVAILLEAKRMIRSTTLTVKEIANNLGFEDHAYFSRLFKKSTNMTPLEFRNTILK